MSIRKLITTLSAFVLSLTSSAMGSGITISASPFSGGYLGIGIGPGLISAFEHFEEDRNAAGKLDQILTPPLATIGFVGSLHFGYSHVFNRLYLGGQLFGEWWTPSAHLTLATRLFSSPTSGNINTFTSNLRIRSAYGVLIRPGVQIIPNSLIYLDLGVAFGNLRVKDTFDFLASGISGIIETHNSSKIGFRAGIGVSVAASKHFAVGIEYFYTYYHHLTLYLPPVFITDSHRNISTHNFLLNLEYLFHNDV
jgi:opacity protein-like surface antigen